jgi:hypothetical protein
MDRRNRIYGKGRIASVVLMLMALAWLTISLPFVYSHQQKCSTIVQVTDEDTQDSTSPFGNTTEEKTEGGATSLSEYLHFMQQFERHFTVLSTKYSVHFADMYVDYHPEMFSPPPEA